MTNPYALAQSGLAQLKAAVHILLSGGPMRQSDISKTLGVRGPSGGENRDFIVFTVLRYMQDEGLVEQLENKMWTLRSIGADADNE